MLVANASAATGTCTIPLRLQYATTTVTRTIQAQVTPCNNTPCGCVISTLNLSPAANGDTSAVVSSQLSGVAGYAGTLTVQTQDAKLLVPKGGSQNYSQDGNNGPTVTGTAQSQVRFPGPTGTFTLVDKGFGVYTGTLLAHVEASPATYCASPQDFYPTVTYTISSPTITSIDHPSAPPGRALSTINVTGSGLVLPNTGGAAVTAAAILPSGSTDFTHPVPGDFCGFVHGGEQYDSPAQQRANRYKYRARSL